VFVSCVLCSLVLVLDVCTECQIKSNQRSSQGHTRAEEKPHPSTTTGHRGANPAARSDAGLGWAMSECNSTSLRNSFVFDTECAGVGDSAAASLWRVTALLCFCFVAHTMPEPEPERTIFWTRTIICVCALCCALCAVLLPWLWLDVQSVLWGRCHIVFV